MILNPTRTAHCFRHGVMTLSATLAAVMMFAIPASAEEIIFDPPVGTGDIDAFAISPDGTQIVMVADLDDGTGSPGENTYVAGLLGSGFANPAIPVAPDGLGDHDGGVKWTPDGQFVTARYVTGASGNEIFLVPANGDANTGFGGATPTQITFGSNNAFDPQISADGLNLFYSDADTPGDGRLYVTPIAGASASSAILLNPGDFSEIDTGNYSQVGADIIFGGFNPAVAGNDDATPENAFYRTAADGSTASTPTLISVDSFPAFGDINFLEVTPDGQTIVFRGDLTTDGQQELYTIPVAGGAFTSLFAPPRPDYNANLFKVSPDGETILFVSDYLQDTVGEAFVVPITGGTPILVSEFLNQNAALDIDVAFNGDAFGRLQFSPDSKSIYYLSDDSLNGTFGLYRVANPLAIPEPAALPLLFAAATLFLRRRR